MGPSPDSPGVGSPIGPVPRETLGFRHAVAICIGIVVGAGIFRTPSLVAANAGDVATVMLAWLAGGLLSIIGALCYAELASTYPGPGGDYSYLRRAFGVRTGFIYAWARLAVIQTGSLALLAFVFADYFGQLVPIGPWGPIVYAASVVLVLTAINWAGVRLGAGTQVWLTALEVGGLVLIIGAGLFLADPASGASQLPPPSSAPQFGLVMVFVLLTFGGWSEAVYVTAELRDAPRRIPRVLVVSLTLVTLLYVLVNAAYLRVLGLGGVAASEAVATDAMRAALGEPGAIVITLAVAIAALTSANATVFTGARTAYALGRGVTGPLRWLGRWDGGRETPGNALILQGMVALLLVVVAGQSRSGFQSAVEFTAPVFWLFMLGVGLALFILRAREPEIDRPFRVPLYPLLPILFCATSVYLLYSSIAYTGWSALAGVGLLAAGALLSFLIRLSPPTKESSP